MKHVGMCRKEVGELVVEFRPNQAKSMEGKKQNLHVIFEWRPEVEIRMYKFYKLSSLLIGATF